jgi:hypothetical protein
MCGNAKEDWRHVISCRALDADLNRANSWEQVKKAMTIWKLPPDFWMATQKGIQFYIYNPYKKNARRGRATDTAGTGTVPTDTKQCQEPPAPGLQRTICRRLGENHEKVDIWTIGNVHRLSHQAKTDRATSKIMGRETHHSPLGPPTSDMDIQ